MGNTTMIIFKFKSSFIFISYPFPAHLTFGGCSIGTTQPILTRVGRSSLDRKVHPPRPDWNQRR